MRVGVTGSGVVALAGVAVGGFLLWQAYRKASAAADGVTAAWDGASQWLSDAGRSISDAATMAAATARQAWGNATTPFVPGDPVRAALYSDAGYSGTLSDGTDVLSSQWFGLEDARRYSYEYSDAARAVGAPVPVESDQGAAFGVYRVGVKPSRVPVDTWDSIISRRGRETAY